MLNLTTTSHIVRLVTTSAASIEAHSSWVDYTAATGAVAPGGSNTPNIETATTTTIVAAPGSGVARNVKGIYVTNVSASASTRVACEIFDGTTAVELIGFILLPGENMTFNEEGKWSHRDAQGAEYPPSGLGAYNGSAIPFMKSGTAADVTGCWYCTAKDTGFPGAWSPGTPGINGRVTNGTAAPDNGCIPLRNPAIGSNFLTELQMAASTNHSHLFFDVLWVNSGLSVTTTTAQSITTPTLPARDVNGTTNGEGCMIGLLVTSTLGNAAANAGITVSYTNSDAVSGRTATLAALAGSQLPQTAVIGTIIWFNLAAGDKGVQSVQSITLTTTLTSGTISLLIARDIATIGTVQANVTAQKIIGSPGVRIYNNSCLLHCYLASATTATFCSGELTVMEK